MISSKKKSILKCIKYIVLSIPVMSMIQMICSFAIEKFGISSDVMNSSGLSSNTLPYFSSFELQ